MKNRKGITIYLESEEDKENYFIFKRLIKRNDDIYLEIERFKDYEIMVGIVYEMFIRSNENNDSLIKRDKEVLNISNFFRIKLREYVKNNI